MERDLFDYKYELLLREMEELQAGIRSYDLIIFTIEGWAITIFSAFVFFVAKENDPIYLSLAGIAVFMFWTLESINKSFQRRLIVRYNRIEHYLRTNFADDLLSRSIRINVPDIGARVSVRDVALKTSAWRAAFFWHTSLLYISMLAIIGVLAGIALGKSWE